MMLELLLPLAMADVPRSTQKFETWDQLERYLRRGSPLVLSPQYRAEELKEEKPPRRYIIKMEVHWIGKKKVHRIWQQYLDQPDTSNTGPHL